MAEHERSAPASVFLPPIRAHVLVNRFLLSQGGSVFAAGVPILDTSAHLWRVPILYTPPTFIANEVGEVHIDAVTGNIQQHTPIGELHKRAAELHDRYQAQIRTVFLHTRKK